jgi:hypothetical protein
MYLLKKSFATKTNVLLILICSTALAISACKKCNKHENVSTTYSPRVGEKWKFNYIDTAANVNMPLYFMISGIDSVVKDTTFYRLTGIKDFEISSNVKYDCGNILKYNGGLQYRGESPQHGNYIDFHLIFGAGINQSIPLSNWQWATKDVTTKYVAYHPTKIVNGIEYKNVEEFVTQGFKANNKVDIHQFFNSEHMIILQTGYHELAGLGLNIEISLLEHRLQ